MQVLYDQEPPKGEKGLLQLFESRGEAGASNLVRRLGLLNVRVLVLHTHTQCDVY